MHIPELKKEACRLIYVCLSVILLYALMLAMAKMEFSPLFRLEILHSMLISTVISLGGGLLLDVEIRHGENKK